MIILPILTIFFYTFLFKIFGECLFESTSCNRTDCTACKGSTNFVTSADALNMSHKVASHTLHGYAFLVFVVQAVDVDDGVNAAVSYSLLSGNTGDAFTVDTNR